MPYLYIICLFLLILCSTPFASTSLTIEPETGFQTNVPVGESDSTYKNCMFAAASLEPSFTIDARIFGWEFSCPIEAGLYFGGPAEFSAGPQVSINRKTPAHLITFGIMGLYNSMPAVYDPTVPETYLEYATFLEWKAERRNPLSAKYEFAFLNDPASGRQDIRNTLQFKPSLKFGSRFVANAKLSAVWDISNIKESGFFEPLASVGGTVLMNEYDYLFFQLLDAFFLSSKTDTAIATNQKGPKKSRSIAELTTHGSQSNMFMISCGYCKCLSETVDLDLNYNFMIIVPNSSQFSYSSHCISIGVEWRIGKQL
jgi:hypothetical protein